MDRVDALPGKNLERLRRFRGGLLSTRVDGELQLLVREAASRLNCPAGLVSLSLQNLQFFRAQYGLGGDLSQSLATDRSLSFCQFVVRDRSPLEVRDAIQDPRLPQEAVARYGCRSYLGMPVGIDGEVIGSLCVFDLVPRSFSDEEREALQALASRVSARLKELAYEQVTRDAYQEMVSLACRPGFEEVRNALAGLSLEVALSRIASTELFALLRQLAASGGLTSPPGLRDAGKAQSDLERSLVALESLAGRIETQLLALDAASQSVGERTDARTLATDALQLAHHATKVAGGVAAAPIPAVQVDLPRPLGVSLLALVLSAAAEAISSAPTRPHLAPAAGLSLRLEPTTNPICFVVESPDLPPEACAAIAAHLEESLRGELRADVVADGARLRLFLPPADGAAVS